MIPVTILGGYLGAGKTTLVNHLLRNANGKKLAVLVNEFGALPIDEDLIEAEGDDLIALAGGCVCCSYGSDLAGALTDLIKRDPPPDHIILEASGVALPGAIAGSLSLMQGLAACQIVVLADAEQIRTVAANTYMADTISRQLEAAETIIATKADLVSSLSLVELMDWLTEQAPNANVIHAAHGDVNPALILDPADSARTPSAPVSAHHDIGNLQTEIQLETGKHDLQAICENLASDPTVVRAKGHAVDLNGQINTIQIVGHRYSIVPLDQSAAMGVVVIRSS